MLLFALLLFLGFLVFSVIGCGNANRMAQNAHVITGKRHVCNGLASAYKHSMDLASQEHIFGKKSGFIADAMAILPKQDLFRL